MPLEVRVDATKFVTRVGGDATIFSIELGGILPILSQGWYETCHGQIPYFIPPTLN